FFGILTHDTTQLDRFRNQRVLLVITVLIKFNIPESSIFSIQFTCLPLKHLTGINKNIIFGDGIQQSSFKTTFAFGQSFETCKPKVTGGEVGRTLVAAD